MNQIASVCDILGASSLPATVETIRRVSSVVGHPSTLRGWLAAWRHAHTLARLHWPADRDPLLRSIHAGLQRSLGPVAPKKRCRQPMLRRLLQQAVACEWWDEGAFAVIAYTFGLRVPSELLRQAKASLFVFQDGRILYGPISRKGQSTKQTLMRWCSCESDALLCPHSWLRIMFDKRPDGLLFTQPCSFYMKNVVVLLKRIGVPDAETFTSHSFRRGAGVDVLEAHGLHAMLRFGQWRSPQSASAYASLDEQTATALGKLCTDVSDDDT